MGLADFTPNFGIPTEGLPAYAFKAFKMLPQDMKMKMAASVARQVNNIKPKLQIGTRGANHQPSHTAQGGSTEAPAANFIIPSILGVAFLFWVFKKK